LDPLLPEGTITPVSTPADAPLEFSYTAAAEHFFVLAVPRMEQRAMGAKSGLTDFNSFKFGQQKLKTDIDMLSAQQGLVVTRSFPNAAAAKIYLNTFKSTQALLRDYKAGETSAFVISAQNYKKLVADRAVAPYLTWAAKHYR
jgi:hypothetical protein